MKNLCCRPPAPLRMSQGGGLSFLLSLRHLTTPCQCTEGPVTLSAAQMCSTVWLGPCLFPYLPGGHCTPRPPPPPTMAVTVREECSLLDPAASAGKSVLGL